MQKKIEEFVRKNPINTGGAIAKHKISITKINDGDIYYRLNIPFWSFNRYAVDSILTFLFKLRKQFSENLILTRNGEIIVDIYESFCDPD